MLLKGEWIKLITIVSKILTPLMKKQRWMSKSV